MIGRPRMSGRRTSGSSRPSLGVQVLAIFSFIFLGKIAVQKMSGRTPGSPRHPSCRHPRPSDMRMSSAWRQFVDKAMQRGDFHWLQSHQEDTYVGSPLQESSWKPRFQLGLFAMKRPAAISRKPAKRNEEKRRGEK